MKLPKFKNATKLALFSTAMILVGMGLFYAMLYSYFDERLQLVKQTAIAAGVSESALESNLAMPFEVIVFPLLFFVVSFLISSLMIDRVLNPVRAMIERIKHINDKNLDSRVFVDTAEDELREYAYVFNDMMRRINEYVERQKRFTSDASHELSTPLTVIVGHATMLQRWGQHDPTLLAASLSTITDEALYMNHLIENLLFLSRTDNDKIIYEFKETDLNLLLSECCGEQRLLHPDFEIVCHAKHQATVLADLHSLKQVFRIVFDNSVKYSEENKKIDVTIANLDEDNAVSIEISDSGIGVNPEHLDRIFDRFFRADDSRNKKTGGTGLGLSIAKEIINGHNGHIFACGNERGGLTIKIVIRISSSNLHAAPMTYS